MLLLITTCTIAHLEVMKDAFEDEHPISLQACVNVFPRETIQVVTSMPETQQQPRVPNVDKNGGEKKATRQSLSSH